MSLISVDTWKASMAKAALTAQILLMISLILGDERMAPVVAESSAGAILMFNPVMALTSPC